MAASFVLDVLVASATPATTAAVEAPQAIVERIYRLAVADQKKQNSASPFYEQTVRTNYFSRSFNRLITASEARAVRDGASMLDFDPISNSQDSELKKVWVKTDGLGLATAVVSAHFDNYGQPAVVIYDFVKEEGAWKIDDFEGAIDKQPWSVRKTLTGDTEPPKDAHGAN